jgi:DNA-binding response OmpR family regulator
MKKVVIALANKMLSEAYKENLGKSGFQAFLAENGEEAFGIIKKELPDLAIVDVQLSVIGGFELLIRLRQDEGTKKIPVIIFSQAGSEADRKKALELMATDFVIGFLHSPRDVAAKVRSYFGEQKRYVIEVSSEEKALKQLAKDLGYNITLRCPSCDHYLSLQLLRDLKAGEKHFIISFVCERCYSK